MLAQDLDAAWLPERVNEWRYVRMRTLFEQRKVKGFPQETLLVSSQKHGVVSKETYGLRTVVAQTGLENLKLVEPGDFVISLRSFQGGIEYARDRGIISPAYTVLRLHENRSLRYFGYLLKSSAFLDAIKITVTGIREGQNIDYSRLGRAIVPLPPLEVQSGIVRYLDHAELRIAKAIQAKQKMVALLNEQKQVIISELVTRGLDPNVPMKDSGQSWLGQIPAHWEVVRLGSVLEERNEMNDKEQVAQVLSLLRKRGVMLYEDKGRVGNKKSENIRRYKIVRENDIVVNCMNVIIGSVGLSSYVGCLSPVYYVLKVRNESASSAYFNNVFQIEPFHKSLVRYGKGILAHRMRISMLDLKAVLIPKPPISEQMAINESIANRTVGIDSAIVAVEREIELLKEYRTVLISDVVTGKKDVRAEASGLPEVDPAELAHVLSGAVSVDGEEDEVDGASETE